MDTGYNSWRLVALSPLSNGARWALGVLLAATVLWALRATRRERRLGRRAALIGLKLLGALALFALLLEPGLQQRQTAQVKSRFALRLDLSRSMGLPASADPTGSTRLALVQDFFRAHAAELRALGERFQLEVAGFAGEPVSLDLAQLAPPAGGDAGANDALALAGGAAGGRTDLLAALGGSGAPAAQTRPLAGVWLISDGADNVQLQHGLGPSDRQKLRALGAPINTLAVGRGGLADLAVANLQVDDFAFVRNPIGLEVTLRDEGFAGETVPVTLTRGGRVLATQTTALDPSGLTKVQLTFTPDQTGEFVFSVSVPVLPGEAVVDNNRRAFVLRVIRDRMRVLLVCGHPSWDERFLRGLLREDPNVDLVSFFILRGVHDDTHAESSELSLIPFPTEEIFRTQLHSFDLVILQDFAYRPFSSGSSPLRIEGYFPDIARYVKEGGALWMIGGENSFGEGGYDETALAEVLPVSGAGLPPPEEPFHPRLTAEGRRHPVTQLAENPEQSAQLWASLPAVPGLNLVRAKPGARVLLTHPLLAIAAATKVDDPAKPVGDGQSQDAPLLVVQEIGQGRSMALTTDASWRWAFAANGATAAPATGNAAKNEVPAAADRASVGGHRLYERFVTNALRWLVRDPDLTPVKLSVDQRTLPPGTPAIFQVKARLGDYGPAAGAQVALSVRDAESDRQVAQASGTASAEGTLRLEVAGLAAGAYRAVAEVRAASAAGQPEAPLGAAEQALAVRESGPETEDPLPHPEILGKIAEATGGKAAALADGWPRLVTAHESEEVEIGQRREQPLWDNAWPLALLALVFGLDWGLRRRWGLP